MGWEGRLPLLWLPLGSRTVCVCGLGSGRYERTVGIRNEHVCVSGTIWKIGSGQAR